MDQIYLSIVRRRRWLLAALLVAGAILAFGASRALPPDNSLRVWFTPDDERFVAYDDYQERFGNDEIIVLHLSRPEGRGVFEQGFLRELAALTTELSEVDDVAHVYSALDPLHLTERPGQPVDPSLVDLTPAELARHRLAALADPLVRGQVVNDDATQAVVVVEPEAGPDFDARRDALVLSVRRIADARFGEDHRPALAGNGVIYQGLNEVTARDFGVFLGAGLLLLFAALAFLSRSLSIMAASAGALVFGTVAALGAYGLAGHHLNIVTALIPTLVMVLGVADAVHFPVALGRAQRELGHDAPAERIAARALSLATLPCLMTTLTTAAGFLALLASPVPAVQHLGLYAAVGVFACFAACVAFMTPVFLRLAGRARPGAPMHRLRGALAALRDTLSVRRGRAALALALLGLTAFLAVGAARLEVDTFTLGNLPGDHRVVRDHDHIESTWGPYLRLEFLARPRDPDADILDDRELQQLADFAHHVTALEDVEDVVYIGSVHHHALIQQVGPERAEAALAAALTPEGTPRASALREAAAAAANDHDLAQASATVLDLEGDRARLMLTAPMTSASALGETLASIDAVARQRAPDLVIEPVGYPPLYVGIIDQVMGTLTQGFLLAIALIFGALLVWLRSARLALASALPNLFPLLAMFGTMGWFGIDLDIATAAVAAIVLGVAVDDTIHFLHAWRHAEAAGLGWDESLRATFDGAGHAAAVTSLLLLIGFPVLTLSEVTSVFAFGLLTSVAAAAALLGDLVLLPLILKLIHSPAHNTAQETHDAL